MQEAETPVRARPIDDVVAKRWEVAVAATRIGDGIEPEIAELIALLKAARATKRP